MSYGLQTENASGELTLSDNGTTYSYIGRASLVSVTQAGSDTVFQTAGHSTYTIRWAGDIVVALPVKVNGSTALVGMTQSGGVWTITVHQGNGSFTALGFDIQESTEVYVFGAPVAVSGYGFALYDDFGNPCADLSRRPLTYAGFVSLGENVLQCPMPAANAPAILGESAGYRRTSVRDGVKWKNIIDAYAWRREATGELYRTTTQVSYATDDGGITPGTFAHATNAVIIDVNGL